MKPDYYKNNNEDYFYKKKSKLTENKEKKSNKNKGKGTFRNYVQDFLDNRQDKDYNPNEE